MFRGIWITSSKFAKHFRHNSHIIGGTIQWERESSLWFLWTLKITRKLTMNKIWIFYSSYTNFVDLQRWLCLVFFPICGIFINTRFWPAHWQGFSSTSSSATSHSDLKDNYCLSATQTKTTSLNVILEVCFLMSKQYKFFCHSMLIETLLRPKNMHNF